MQSLVIRNDLAPVPDGLRVFTNISPLISTTGINHGLDHVKCIEVLVHRSSPVCKLASTIGVCVLHSYRKKKRNTIVITATLVNFFLAPTVYS